MRTTVEMKPEHRTALIALAARRGQKGFSAVLEEAIEVYLAGEDSRDAKRNALAALAGALTQEEADELRRTTTQIRETWR
jgi:hypothetical protein